MKDPVTQLILKFCGPILTAAWLCGDAPAANADDMVCPEFRAGCSVETPLPVVMLTGPDRLTNECHSAFTDPGATARGGPVAIAAGLACSLALQRDGVIVAWGAATNGSTGEPYGESVVPGGLGKVVAIAAGDLHSLALQRDGTIVAWGYNGFGQTDVPEGLSNVVAIAGGGWHSLALQRDGLVVAWGDNLFGQTNVPASLNGVVAIAGGGVHSLALQHDGTVVGWGDSSKGQTTVPAGLSDLSSRIA